MVKKIKPLTVAIGIATKVEYSGDGLKIIGPKGELFQNIEKEVKIDIKDGQVIIESVSDTKRARAIQGLMKALISNAVLGVNDGFAKTLELSGVGYRAAVSGDELTLSVGFSHPVKIQAPVGISFSIFDNKIRVNGIDKHMVGQIAHTIRAVRPPEPYKGKGIRYEGEKIRRKAGKAAAKTVGAK